MYVHIGTNPWIQSDVTKGNHRVTVLATCPGGGGKKIRRNFRFKVAEAATN